MQTPVEDVKEQMMEAEPSEQKRKRSATDPEVNTQRTPGKLSEKKRRRSQTAEGSESDVPSKIKKTSESGEKEKIATKSGKLSQCPLMYNPRMMKYSKMSTGSDIFFLLCVS